MQRRGVLSLLDVVAAKSVAVDHFVIIIVELIDHTGDCKFTVSQKFYRAKVFSALFFKD